MTNKIKFTYIGDYAYEVHDRPTPSAKHIPQWFANMPSYTPTPTNPEGKRIEIVNGVSTATAKKCSPMLDAMTTGYTVSLWTDILVEQNDNGFPNISWRVKRDVFKQHGVSGQEIPAPPGYLPVVLKYLTDFRVSTPPGYSILIKPPAGHYDLPFMAATAIIDSDSSVIDTNIPVWIKENTSGIIEKGTPIAQIFPFKREDWEAEFDVISEEKFDREVDKGFHKTLVNNYIKNHRKNKKFV
jgi:hypothetical protein